MRRWLVRLAFVAFVVAIVTGLRATVFAPPPIPVRVVAVERGRVELTVTNSRAGTVKARRRAKLSPENGGRVVALPHPEGSTVRAGDILLRLDDELQRARLAVAERELAAARAQRDQACLTAEHAAREDRRTGSLARDGIVSAGVLDQTESAARAAEAACRAAAAAVERSASSVALSRVDVAKTVLSAPFAGIVAELSIQVGEWTTPSPPGLPIPPVIDLIDVSSIYVAAPMDEVDSARMRAGQAARVTVDSHQGRSFPARLVRVAPYVLDIEAQNRTVEIELELEDAAFARTLLPGTSADAEVILDARDDALRIPTGALMEGGRVLVLENGRLAERSVKPGLRNWNFTEVSSGLTGDETVVVAFDRAEIKAGAKARPQAAPGS
jgi:HlyD family secretion protein